MYPTIIRELQKDASLRKITLTQEQQLQLLVGAFFIPTQLSLDLFVHPESLHLVGRQAAAVHSAFPRSTSRDVGTGGGGGELSRRLLSPATRPGTGGSASPTASRRIQFRCIPGEAGRWAATRPVGVGCRRHRVCVFAERAMPAPPPPPKKKQ